MPLLVLLILAAVPHTGSISASRLVLEQGTAGLQVRCQILSLLEVIEGLDADGDGSVSTDELARRSAAIAAYVGAHYSLSDASGGDEGGVALVPRDATVAPARAEVRPVLRAYDLVDVRLSFEADAPIERLAVRVDLFRRTSPDHCDTAEVVWNGRAPITKLLQPGDEVWVLAAPAGVAPDFLRSGLRTGYLAWAALAALCALLLAGPAPEGERTRGGRILACFLGPELAALALGALSLVPSGAFVLVLAAPLSVAYLGADHLVRTPSRPRLFEVLLFGAVHGLALASPLRTELAGEREQVAALAAFLTGLLLVQLGLGALAAWALRATEGVRPRRVLAAGLALLGLVAFVLAALGRQ